MSKVKGQNFRLFVAGAAVPEATNCTVTYQGNTEDTSTKDTEGFWNKETVVSKSWSAQVDNYQSDAESLQALVGVFMAAQPVTVGWDQTTGAANTQNRTGANASFKRTGQALLNDLSIQFNDRTTINVTSQYQGTGALS